MLGTHEVCPNLILRLVLQEYRPLMDWKIVAAAPLVIENQLPVRGTYLIWETPRVCSVPPPPC